MGIETLFTFSIREKFDRKSNAVFQGQNRTENFDDFTIIATLEGKEKNVI